MSVCCEIKEDLEISHLLTVMESGVIKIGESLERSLSVGYPEAIKKTGETAFALYTKLTEMGKEPRIPVRIATNRFKQTGCHPTSVNFWREYDAITSLYEFLKMEGYYA